MTERTCRCLDMNTDEWPMAIGRRVWWGRTPDGARPIPLPVVSVEKIHTDDRGVEHGFMARLATESHVIVELTYDPCTGASDKSPASLWVYVEHPVTGNRCAASFDGDVVVYDAWCGDEDNCSDHDHFGWFDYVYSAQSVMEWLSIIGRLEIRAVLNRGDRSRSLVAALRGPGATS